MIMTSAGATARQAGRGPGAGLPAASTIVRLTGALDFAAAPALRERLTGMLHPGIKLLVLDLSRVPSCDPAGLAVLIGIQRRARLLGIVVRLVAPSLPVATLLRLTGLDRSLTICPDLRGALARKRHEPTKAAPVRLGNTIRDDACRQSGSAVVLVGESAEKPACSGSGVRQG
jgi:anti-anti-sigma factor